MAPEQFLRRAGYGYFRDRRSGKESFSRRLGQGIFPKLHMYVMEQGDKIVFDLHLDQKQPSYQGARMHNAEHDGEVVENEIERLKGLITPAPDPSPAPNVAGEGSNDIINSIGGNREYDKNAQPPEKKSWWKIF